MIVDEACEAGLLAYLAKERPLDARALVDARLESELSGLPLVAMLIKRDVVGDADVAKIVAEQNGLRFLDLTRRKPSAAWALVLPENIARRKCCLVFGEVSGQLVIAVADPVDPAVRAAVSTRFQRPLQYVVSPRYQILDCIDQIYGEARAKGARFVDVVPISEAVARITDTGLNMVEQLDSIIDEAVDRRASDIHIEPQEDRVRVRLRVDGRLLEARAYPLETLPSMISRIKVLAKLDITEHRRGLDGRISHRSFDQDIDIRVAIIPAANGERITMRLLSTDRSNLTLDKLGMGLQLRQGFERLIRRPHGIILITGPTGSGKSTTLYAALSVINTPDKHIITVEDPVEYRIAGVNQVQVDEEFGVSFASALRSIVRHDPDVIMVGEIRDQETAHLALEASLTGHLVFATLHTNSAVGAVTRLLDMGCEAYLVASSLVGCIAQRLVRRICSHCKQKYEPNATEKKMLGIPIERLGATIARGAGCARCLRTGYYDRVGIFEHVAFDEGLSELVMQKAATETLHKYAVAHGAITLREDAITKVRDELTTLEDALRVTVEAGAEVL